MSGDKTVYCHFSFKRPKGKDYGLFAVAFYWDYDGKQKIKGAQATRKYKLWQDHQWITSIQSYEHALYSIYLWQGVMIKNHIKNVMLVTDNSILAGWILNPKKNKEYTEYMNKAVEKYRAGGINEITIGIGLCEVRDYEKAYKYCKEEKVINEDEYQNKMQVNDSGIDVRNTNSSKQFLNIYDLDKDNLNIPVINGISDIKSRGVS